MTRLRRVPPPVPEAHPELAFGRVEIEPSKAAKKRLGAVSELRAAAHLMAQGFDVYRCVAAHGAFDLVASRDGVLYRVEVKTITNRSTGCLHIPIYNWPSNDDWDIVVFCSDAAIFQFPFGVTRDHVRAEIVTGLGLPLIGRKVRITLGLDQPKPTTQDWVMQIMKADPAVRWTGPAMLDALLAEGWTTTCKGPRGTVASTLADLYNKNLVDRVERGLYALPGVPSEAVS